MRPTVGLPDFDRINRGFEDDIGRSLHSGMAEVGATLLSGLRADTEAAGLGARLAKTWRMKVFPSSGKSLDPAVWVWTKAPKLIDVFQRGATIRSSHGFWLAIPTPAAGGTGIKRTGGKEARITPGGFERRTGMRLRMIYRPGRKTSFLVVDNARLNSRGIAAANMGRSRRGGAFTRLSGRTTVIVFILVRQVTLRARLHSDSIVDRVAAMTPAAISKHWT